MENHQELSNKLAQLEEQLRELKDRIKPTQNKFQLPTGDLHFVCFQLDSQHFSFYLPVVLEIIRMVKLTPLAGAPAFIAGMLNVRGDIVPVLDLRSLLGMAAKPFSLNTPIM